MTNTTEYSTTAPTVYVAPPVTTSSTTITTQYPNGVVTRTTLVYSSAVTSLPVVMVPSPGPVVMAPRPVVQVASATATKSCK